MGDTQRNSNGNTCVQIVLCCLQCILAELIMLLEFVNDLAYAQIAIFGDSYVQAVKCCVSLFVHTAGWHLILADLIVRWVQGFCEGMSALVVGCAGGALGYLLCQNAPLVYMIIAIIILAIFGLLWGFFCAKMVMEIIGSMMD